MKEDLENEDLNENLEDENLENEENELDEETVALAKSMGWVEEVRFRGDKSNWVGADKFVEKGMNDLPVLRERLRAQSRKLNDMESDINQFKTHHEESLSREYQRAVKELEDKQLATVEDGDTDEYQKIQKQKQSLAMAYTRNHPTSREAPGNPVYKDWKDKNSEWFEKDAKMTSYANFASDYIAANNEGLIGKPEFLDEVDKMVRKEFPDKFENPARRNPNTVESGGRQNRSRGSKSYTDLPAEAKAACDKFVRRGLITKEQYVQDYEWE